MDTSEVYMLVAGGILIILLTFRVLSSCMFIFQNPKVQYWLFKHLIYPRLHFITYLPRYEVICQALYWVGTISSNIVGVTSLKEASLRAARLSLVNFTPLFFSNQLSLAAYILGIPLRGIVRFHGSIATVALSESLFHIATIVTTKAFSLKNISHLYGIIAAATVTILVLVLFIRKQFYEIFLKIHLSLAIATAFVLYQHAISKTSRLLLFIASVTFGINILFWLTRILYRNIPRIQANKPRPKPKPISFSTLNNHEPKFELQHITRSRSNYRYCSGSVVEEESRKVTDCIQLHIKLPRPWNIRAGQHIQLCLPTLGFWSLIQTHPFMIVWWEKNKEDVSIILLIEKRKGFTSRLLDLTNTQPKEFPILLDGPYGCPEDLGIYGTVVLFALDIGIAAVIPYVRELLEKSMKNQVCTKKINLIWKYSTKGYPNLAHSMVQKLLEMENPGVRENEMDENYKMYNHILDITLDHSSAFDEFSQTLGKHGRLHLQGGDFSIEHLIWKNLPDVPGRIAVAVSADPKIRDQVRDLVYESGRSDVVFKDLGFKMTKRSGKSPV